MTGSTKDHGPPEQVLAFDAEWLGRLGYFNGFKDDPSYLDPAQHKLRFRDRSEVEYELLRADWQERSQRWSSAGGLTA